MHESIESVRCAVAAWREAHPGRRGPFPRSLKERITSLLTRYDATYVAESLSLGISEVLKWQDGTTDPAKSSSATTSQTCSSSHSRFNSFVDIGSLGDVLSTEPTATQTVVELSGPRGQHLRIAGQLDRATQCALVQAALGDGVSL